MKTSKLLTLSLSIMTVSLLTACGTSKSNQPDSNGAEINSLQTVASCNRSTSTSFSYNLSAVTEATTGQINQDWIKIKFDFLATDLTQAGYSLKFYKWRVVGSSAQLDPNPLTFTTYSLSTGQSGSDTSTGVYTTQVNQQSGYYIRLNDDANYPYQVLKVVAYKSDGTIAAQTDALIPLFSANPAGYKTNTDGSVRADNLQKLHPLYATDTASWSEAQFKQQFEQYCF